MEAIWEISYFQSTQKPKCHIYYPYGPTKLPGKVWGHAASACPSYKMSILLLYTIEIEKLDVMKRGHAEAAWPQTLPGNLVGPYG